MEILKDASRFIVTLILITAAHAAALPTDTVVRNVNGVQQCVKTYTLSPDFPSEKLAEAAGVETQSYPVSASREFTDPDSNDMSYIPASVTKDGVTLSLQSVDWQVQESELVEDMLIPSSYKAVASYAGTGYRKAATGYVSTASYAGTVSCRLLKDVTYTVTYVGVPIEPPPKETEEPTETTGEVSESAERPNESGDMGETSEAPPVADTPDVPETPGEQTTETERTDDGMFEEIPREPETVEIPETRQTTNPKRLIRNLTEVSDGCFTCAAALPR